MKYRTTAVLLAMAFLLIAGSSVRVQAQTYTQYKIQLNSDGSAAWIVTEVSGINGTIDTWQGFQDRLNALVSAAEVQSGRPMGIDNDTLQMSTTITSSQSKTTEYMFTWLNFSRTVNGQIVVGDVFDVPGFFNQLYGDGALQISYPLNYTLKSVSPEPDIADNSSQTLQWLGTQFFVADNPNIVLQVIQPTPNNSGQQTIVQSDYLLIGLVSAVAIVTVVASLFFINRQRKQKNKPKVMTVQPFVVESEEEKILRVLRSSGGSAFQSAITDQCKFSKAKTSQLLTALEAKGIIRRYKKGRDKIVNLIEETKGEK